MWNEVTSHQKNIEWEGRSNIRNIVLCAITSFQADTYIYSTATYHCSALEIYDLDSTINNNEMCLHNGLCKHISILLYRVA